jgi:hypothetical protein
MKRISLALLAALSLSACAPAPTQTMPLQSTTRVEVTRIGVIADDIAYHNVRGIYVIKDRETGQEFIGVSGVGITEVGQHNCGKNCNTEDER